MLLGSTAQYDALLPKMLRPQPIQYRQCSLHWMPFYVWLQQELRASAAQACNHRVAFSRQRRRGSSRERDTTLFGHLCGVRGPHVVRT